jgi:antitoxin (DNA-binding transcriptional repressor) of toxin-antitoxin stability system
MRKVDMAVARRNLRALVDEVASGREVALLRRGREVARLVPPPAGKRRLPSLEALRKSIRLEGEPLSRAVVRGRAEERA